MTIYTVSQWIENYCDDDGSKEKFLLRAFTTKDLAEKYCKENKIDNFEIEPCMLEEYDP